MNRFTVIVSSIIIIVLSLHLGGLVDAGSQLDTETVPSRTPTPIPPAAGFSALPTSGPAPLVVDFSNLSTGDINECHWDFGDGRTMSTCGSPSNTYESEGRYTVSLTVTGPGGEDTMTKTDYIVVFSPPEADFSASPTSGPPPFVVDFSNLSTGDINECHWDFGDGRTMSTCGSPSNTYESEGRYTVSLTVTGPGGEDTMTKTDYIAVFSPPEADFSASPTSGVPPLSVKFTNLSTGEFDECLWDFGNGRTATTCDHPSDKYETDGHHTISLTVKGPGGEDTMTKEKYVKVGYSRLFLPLAASRFNGPYRYFYDFSDPNSGWFSEDFEKVRVGYLNEEYQILLKTAWWGMGITSDLVLPGDYSVEVDARQVSGAAGPYGLMFGYFWGEDSSEGYQFLVYPPAQIFMLEKKKMDGSWHLLIDWTYSPAIEEGTGTNHLRVDRKGSGIDLTINDDLVAQTTDSSFTSPGRDAGVRVYSFEDAPVDVRFDNFAAVSIP